MHGDRQVADLPEVQQALHAGLNHVQHAAALRRALALPVGDDDDALVHAALAALKPAAVLMQRSTASLALPAPQDAAGEFTVPSYAGLAIDHIEEVATLVALLGAGAGDAEAIILRGNHEDTELEVCGLA
ncbi:MAG: hypothetical protein ACPGUV_07220, partial [Polyangiales bacterium]